MANFISVQHENRCIYIFQALVFSIDRLFCLYLPPDLQSWPSENASCYFITLRAWKASFFLFLFLNKILLKGKKTFLLRGSNDMFWFLTNSVGF